jgi:hypothetical protein
MMSRVPKSSRRPEIMRIRLGVVRAVKQSSRCGSWLVRRCKHRLRPAASVPLFNGLGAYNRAAHLKRRKELAQIWADLILEDAKPAASLLEGPRG